MCTWQAERRKRTRHLIELGGLVLKSGIVDLTRDDRATIFGALLWMSDKLKSNQGKQARALWATKGNEALSAERKSETCRLKKIARGTEILRASSSEHSIE